MKGHSLADKVKACLLSAVLCMTSNANSLEVLAMEGVSYSTVNVGCICDVDSLVEIRDISVSTKGKVNAIIKLKEKALEEEKKKLVNTGAQTSININKQKFSGTSIRLNTEIYNVTADILNIEHIIGDYGEMGTPLYESYLEYVNPIMPIAMTTCETSGWADTSITWSSAIYSKLLKKEGTDMSKLKVERVNVDTYVNAGLCSYLGCGANCTAGKSVHYHEVGLNDNDSIGPLQILRRYVEDSGVVKYPCGETTTDLMSWEDNVQYFTHRQSDAFANEEAYARDHVLQTDVELMAIMAICHNTGSSFMYGKSAGSLWYGADAVYEFCEKLGSEDSRRKLCDYVDKWYEECVTQENFMLAGEFYGTQYSDILKELGINMYDYASGFKHKQTYPIRAVLNYLSLQKLYHSDI